MNSFDLSDSALAMAIARAERQLAQPQQEAEPLPIMTPEQIRGWIGFALGLGFTFGLAASVCVARVAGVL